MPTFIYQPGVKVYIQTEKHGIIDISSDLVDGTMVRRSDGVSTFNFDLNNPRRKYDNIFTPNDRVVVMMKRLAWVRTMTGLLNSVPLISVWPRVVTMAASCSLKRLQYWYWDQYAPATQEMIRQALAASASDPTNTDGGVTNVVLSILKKVVGWPESKVHIARIPDDWFKIAYKVAEQVDQRAEQADALAAQFYSTLSGGGSIAGIASGSSINGALTSGSYAGVSISSDQATNATTIYGVGKNMGATDRDVVIGLATAMQESKLTNLSGGDRDSVGLFQQRPSAGWGTVAQCHNPTYAATQFFTREMKVANRTSMKETQVAQAVQRSAFPNAYQQWVAMGQAMVRSMNGVAVKLGTPAAGGSVGTSTGEAFAKVGAQLVEKYPHIRYTQQYTGTRLDILSRNPPPGLDCSSFVQAVYLRTMGALYDIPRKASAQAQWCKAKGMQKLTPKQAMNTPGALLFLGSTEAAVHHVEVSLGNGNQTVGAHHPGTDAHVATYGSPNYFNFGYLIPRLSYPGGVGGGTTTDLGGALSGDGTVQGSAQDPTTGADLPGYNPNDKFDKLFGNASWAPETPQDNPDLDLAAALTGVRALLNDQPLLPYLKNLFNSTMRSYCSAPNGDLIAWFPDYYGLWGTAGKMVVEAIECQDFTVEWADDFFVTHQFTLAGQVNYLDVNSGSVDTDFQTSTGADIRAFTMGIATVDIPAIMYALFGIDASKQEALNFANYIYKRFGARPDYQQMDGLTGPKAEFFSALFMFMRQWAYQYNSNIPLTFMPELWPGMLIQMPWADFQAYITTVTHSFQFGSGGGFTTSVNIAAPARLPKTKTDRDNVLVGLPLAGDYKPGRGIGNTNPDIDDDVAPQKVVTQTVSNVPVSM